MDAIIYYISLPFFYIIAYLPEKLLYAFSDLIFFILYRLVGYRKEVVRMNLRNSFPEKSEAEIQTIEVAFYKHFTDVILETIAAIRANKSRLMKQVSYCDTEIMHRYKTQKQSLIYVSGHTGNWELTGLAYGLHDFHPFYVLYSPLKNTYFDKLMLRMRSNTGVHIIPMKDALRVMIKNRSSVTATGFIADQTPPPETATWVDFLNQKTPFFNGPAKLAIRFNYPVIYFSLKKTARGRYEIMPKVVAENPAELTAHEITLRFARSLENDIMEMPFNWLWSHRRWKHKPGD